MMDWFTRRIFTVGDVGRWHARSGYPRADSFVMLPLYGTETLPTSQDPGPLMHRATHPDPKISDGPAVGAVSLFPAGERHERNR